MTAPTSHSKKPASIGVLVAAGMVPGIVWLILLLVDSRVDTDRCDAGSARSTRWFGVPAQLPLMVLATTAIVLTVAAAVALVRWWRVARRSSGRPASTRAFLAVSSLVALGLFVPLGAASVVQLLEWRSC